MGSGRDLAPASGARSRWPHAAWLGLPGMQMGRVLSISVGSGRGGMIPKSFRLRRRPRPAAALRMDHDAPSPSGPRGTLRRVPERCCVGVATSGARVAWASCIRSASPWRPGVSTVGHVGSVHRALRCSKLRALSDRTERTGIGVPRPSRSCRGRSEVVDARLNWKALYRVFSSSFLYTTSPRASFIIPSTRSSNVCFWLSSV